MLRSRLGLRSRRALSSSALPARDGAPPPLFEKLLIANRGEIACRITRTARRLGIKTVAVYSAADAGAQHVAEADEAICLGPAPTSESYLRPERLIEAAQRTGAQAVHPGYGFLSESAEFAEALEGAGLTFVGPPSSAIRSMGSKANAKAVMSAAGVPVTPGYWGEDASLERFAAEGEALGYPIMLKAVRGGGGKGMRIVRSAAELPSALEACRREAATSFGSSAVLLERYLPRPRHIEFQVMADKHGSVVHLFERDCSVQRRHQKVLEEAPAPGLPSAVRAAMGAAAVKAAAAVGYVGAGTVEFMLDAEALEAGGARAANPFFFMEMNCRLQVEHPVTEMVLGGLDLVELQLRVAAGRPLGLTQADIAARLRGHALEARVYAENPSRDFLPATGLLRHLRAPAGALLGGTAAAHAPVPRDAAAPILRVDSGVRAGDAVSVYYDPMVSKLVVWGENRAEALAAMGRGLAAYQVVGLPTNLAFLQRLVAHPAFAAGGVDTSFLAQHLAQCLPPLPPPPAPSCILALAALASALRALPCALGGARSAAALGAASSPWAPGAVTCLQPMQPSDSAMPFVLAEREPSPTAGAIAEEEEEQGGSSGSAGLKEGERRVQVTPLGPLPYSVNGSIAPAFLLVCPAGNGQPALQHVAVGLVGAGEGSGGAQQGEGAACQTLSLTAHIAPVSAPTAAAAAAALLSLNSSVLKATVVLTPAPPRLAGGSVRPGGFTEVSVFPQDPKQVCIPGILNGPGAGAGEGAASGSAPGTYRLFLPVHPVGVARAGAADKSGAAAMRAVVAPMPGKVVKVLVEEGACEALRLCGGACALPFSLPPPPLIPPVPPPLLSQAQASPRGSPCLFSRP